MKTSRALPVLAAAAAALALAACGGGSPTTTTNANGKLSPGVPVSATQTQLVHYENSVKHSVYWIGPYAGFTYELTETSNFDTYVRYLPPGIPVGDRNPSYTTIGTYPAANAYTALQADIKKGQFVSHTVSYKGVAAWSKQHPTSVYLAYPKFPFLIEIFDPSSAHALKIALSGEIEPVRAPTTTTSPTSSSKSTSSKSTSSKSTSSKTS